jgi:hypothetical protein
MDEERVNNSRDHGIGRSGEVIMHPVFNGYRPCRVQLFPTEPLSVGYTLHVSGKSHIVHRFQFFLSNTPGCIDTVSVYCRRLPRTSGKASSYITADHQLLVKQLVKHKTHYCLAIVGMDSDRLSNRQRLFNSLFATTGTEYFASERPYLARRPK